MQAGTDTPDTDRSFESRTIVAFDLETIPDPDLGRGLYGASGDTGEVIEAMLSRRLEETDQRSSFYPPPFHRIVSLSLAVVDLETRQFRLETPAGAGGSEFEHLQAFHALCARRPAPRLVSWNGRGFDLPVIRYRSMVHGLSTPAFYAAGRHRGRGGYGDRYDTLHIDLMDALSGLGASPRVRLDDWSRILGLPGKQVTTGSEVHRHFARGERQEITTYCEIDALNTLLAYLVWEQHRGRLSEDDFAAWVATVRGVLVADERPAVVQFGEALEDWR